MLTIVLIWFSPGDLDEYANGWRALEGNRFFADVANELVANHSPPYCPLRRFCAGLRAMPANRMSLLGGEGAAEAAKAAGAEGAEGGAVSRRLREWARRGLNSSRPWNRCLPASMHSLVRWRTG